MAKLLFRMRHVPDDEAAEVRALLEQHEIEYFETFAGNWGISLPALWLKHEEQYSQARQILDEYQAKRGEKMRAEYEEQRALGQARTMWHSFMDNPLRFIAYFAMIGIVLYFSLSFFLGFI